VVARSGLDFRRPRVRLPNGEEVDLAASLNLVVVERRG